MRLLATVAVLAFLAAGMESKAETPSPPAKPAQNGKAKAHNGLVLANPEGDLTLKVSGFAQTRYTLSAPEGGGRTHNFDLALGRLAFSGSVLDPRVTYFFQAEASTFGNTNRLTMLDAWIQYRASGLLGMQAGRFILPYSRQFYTHPGNLLFTDLSAADYAFNLQRSVGASAGGRFRRLSYHAAAVNSIRALDAGGQHNFGGDLGVLGRLELDVLEPYGYMESLPVPVGAAQFSIGLAAGFNPVAERSAFQNALPGDRTTSLTVDAGYRWGRLTLQGAGYFRRNNFQAPGRPLGEDWGSYAQFGYYVVPKRWELAARVSSVDFDAPNNPDSLGDVTEYTLGLNHYLRGHNVKLQVDYSMLSIEPFHGSSQLDHRLRAQFQILF